MNQRQMVISLVLATIMVGSAFAILGGVGNLTGGISANGASAQSVYNPSGISPQVTSLASSSTAWTYPTTTMNEPGYTNGTFKMGINCNVNTLNYFPANTYCDVYVLDEVYDSMFNTLPNGTTIPWLATGYTVTHVTTNNTTFDIACNSNENYSYIYTVNLRPNVQWTDWSAANASSTYTFSNHTCYYVGGAQTYHNYTSFKSTTMKTYYLQSADVVLSWRMQAGFGIWPNVVNVVPNGNLSVKVYVTKQTLIILPDSLSNDILPYHIWVHHDFNGLGLWNCSTVLCPPGGSNPQGYYGWNLGWNTRTGLVPGLVGTGPFMVTNNYGLPQGQIIPSQEETFFANPHYFVQYANASSGLRQFTPKFWEIDMPFYSSESGLVAAYQKGEIDTTSLAPPPGFLPQLEATPGGVIYKKDSSAYGYFKLNTNVPPLNITAFRQGLNYATPTAYMASVIEDGYGILSSDPINPTNTLFYNASAPQYTFDLAKAAQMIDSIPGMVNTSKGLMYNGTQVCVAIQTTVGSVAPNNIEAIEATIQDWNILGIKATLKEEAFTTLITNFIAVALSDTSVSNASNNAYEMLYLGTSTAPHDPALDCRDSLNPVYGVPTTGYAGPFSSLTVNGKTLTGLQVQSLFDNLTNELVNTNSFKVAQQLADEIQTLYIDEAVIINTGYGIDLVPLQTNTFTNYSTTNTLAMFDYWYWQFFSIHTHTVVQVSKKYSLSVSEFFDNGTTFTAGTYGNVTFTVMNGTSVVPGAQLTVGAVSPYGGLLNVTSNTLTTNSNGQAIWEYEVAPYLSEDMKYCNATGVVQTAHVQNASVSVVAVQPNAADTAPGISQGTIAVVNGPALQVSYKLNQDQYTNGQNGSITFTVTERTNNTTMAYAGATLLVNMSLFGKNGVFNVSAFTTTTLATNASGEAIFNFTVLGNLTSAVLEKEIQNGTITVNVMSNNNSIYGNSIQVLVPLKAVKPVVVTSSLNTLNYVLIGIVVAVAVIAAVAISMSRRQKVKP